MSSHAVSIDLSSCPTCGPNYFRYRVLSVSPNVEFLKVITKTPAAGMKGGSNHYSYFFRVIGEGEAIIGKYNYKSELVGEQVYQL